MFTVHHDTINRQSKSPIYRQIAEHIRLQISEGRLPVGTQLPTVRQLANSLSVTRLTVQNAYRDLQADGWIESVVGRGTFVAGSADEQAVLDQVGQEHSSEHVMHDMSLLARVAGLRSLGYAAPDPALYPTADFMRFFEHPMSLDPDLMKYGMPQGDDMLRVEISKLLTTRHVHASPDQVIVTSGVSQGLAILTGCLAKPGGVVAVEQPVYLGMLNVLKAFGVQAVGVPVDSEGMRMDALERVIREHHPRFVYTIPSFQNPTGVCLSEQRRGELLALASKHRIYVVEDDIYGMLSYDGPPPTPLKAVDRADRVIYVNSCSKILLPGLRLGYMVVPEALRDQFVMYRQALDFSGPLLLQRALANFLHRGRLKVHLERVLPQYRERRDVMLDMLAQKMPSYVSWTRPAGGYCCWLTMPAGRVKGDLHKRALKHGIAFTPGHAFLINPDEQSYTLRLCFSGVSTELIREAVTIMGSLLAPPYASPPPRLRGVRHELPLV